MATYEENMQKVIDLRAQVLDVDREDPPFEEVYEAIEALHATRGVAAAKKKAAAVVPIDLNELFKKE